MRNIVSYSKMMKLPLDQSNHFNSSLSLITLRSVQHTTSRYSSNNPKNLDQGSAVLKITNFKLTKISIKPDILNIWNPFSAQNTIFSCNQPKFFVGWRKLFNSTFIWINLFQNLTESVISVNEKKKTFVIITFTLLFNFQVLLLIDKHKCE